MANKSLKLTKEQREGASALLREYLEVNFDVEIGNLGSDLFLDFLEEKIIQNLNDLLETFLMVMISQLTKLREADLKLFYLFFQIPAPYYLENYFIRP